MLKFYLYPGINKSRWLSDPDYLPLFAPHYLLFEFLSLIWHRTYFAICCICISHVLPAVVVPCVGVHNQSSPSLLKPWCRLPPLCCLSRFISVKISLQMLLLQEGRLWQLYYQKNQHRLALDADEGAITRDIAHTLSLPVFHICSLCLTLTSPLRHGVERMSKGFMFCTISIQIRLK